LGKALQTLAKCPVPKGIDKKWSEDETVSFTRLFIIIETVFCVCVVFVLFFFRCCETFRKFVLVRVVANGHQQRAPLCVLRNEFNSVESLMQTTGLRALFLPRILRVGL
jgi:hypothetical protein